MDNSKYIQTTLRTFHLDNPEATWEELRDRLKFIAEDILESSSEWDRLDTMGLVYSDHMDDFRVIGATRALTVPQAKALTVARELMRAAEAKTTGDLQGLVDVIEKLTPEVPVAAPVAAPVVDTSGNPPVTFRKLGELYLEEQSVNLKPSTQAELRSSLSILSGALGSMNMVTHTRKDMLTLREKLSETRKPSTVNKLLVRLVMILDWGVNNGYMDRHFAGKLRLTKDAESTRKAFTQDQLKAMMDYANGTLSESSWARWVLSLGVITGARIGEISQLTVKDIHVGSDGMVTIDIHEREGNSLKNKYSSRVVPLVDGALGFDLKAFLQYVATCEDVLFPVKKGSVIIAMGNMVRDILKLKPEERDLTFHSLRHSMASNMKAKGIALGTVQAILGHSSQSITFDHYGGNSRQGLGMLQDALRLTFDMDIDRDESTTATEGTHSNLQG